MSLEAAVEAEAWRLCRGDAFAAICEKTSSALGRGLVLEELAVLVVDPRAPGCTSLEPRVAVVHRAELADAVLKKPEHRAQLARPASRGHAHIVVITSTGALVIGECPWVPAAPGGSA